MNAFQETKRVVRLFLLPHKWLFAGSIGTGFIAAAASGIGLPFMIAFIFPVLFTGPDAAPPFARGWIEGMAPQTIIMLACMSMPIMFIIRGFGMWSNAMVVNWLGIRILTTMRMAFFRRVQELPLGYLEGQQKGDILSRLLSDTQMVQILIAQSANDLIKQPVTCLAAVCAFFTLLLQHELSAMLFFNLIFVAVAIFPILRLGKLIAQKSHRAQKGLGELNTIVQQNLEGQREIRSYAMEQQQISDFDAEGTQYANHTIKINKYQQVLRPCIEVVAALALSFLLIGGKKSGMSLEDFLPLATALFMTFDSMKRAGRAYNRFNQSQGALKRLMEILDEPNTMPDPEQPRSMPTLKGEISFEKVSFAYANGKTVLEGIDLQIPAGQIVGLVGPSGAGKSTFASLIPRFYDVSAGRVLVDGLDVREVRQRDLRAQIALVGQHSLLFSGSIRENIALGRPNASEQDVLAAAEAASVSGFVAQQAEGLDKELGEGGVGLSGGQRQRVAIARAFVKDAPILILDEATASLDAQSEGEIQKSLEQLSQGRTTLIVAHRFSTLRHAHRILVFEHGRVIADGPHEQLYAECELYRELYDKQGLN